MRKTTNYASILQRRSVLMDAQNDDVADLITASLVSTTLSNEGSNSSSTSETYISECSARSSNIDLIYDQLDALTKQDTTTYIIHDYIGRRYNRQRHHWHTTTRPVFP